MDTLKYPSKDRATERRAVRLEYTRAIEEACQDPGARRALRAGVRRDINAVRQMHRLVVPRLPDDAWTSDDRQRAYYAVAAMIADQPRHRFSSHEEEPGPDEGPDRSASANEAGISSDANDGADGKVAEPAGDSDKAPSRLGERYGTSLGATFALAVLNGPGRDRQMRESTAESRLHLLTRQSLDGLLRHLPASTRYLRSLDVPVDFARLLDDLIAWPTQSNRIARRWLQDFYRLREKAERKAKEEEDTTSENLLQNL